jgi:hypothetical protein
MGEILHVRSAAGIHGYDKRDLTWTGTDKAGMQLAAVRADREHGQFLGYLSFDRHAETGVHQRLGPAFSYFLQGGLADFQGFAREGDVGINLAGATHSAISYAPTLMASRLEAPVIYPSEDSVKGEVLHTGARPGEIVNHAPEIMPDINIPLDSLPWIGTQLAGVQRRMVFDYAETEKNRRHVQLRLLPYTQLPAFRATAPVDVFIIGGDLTIGGETQTAGGFFVIDEGAVAEMSTQFGALVLIWAEGRGAWLNAGASDLFGFAPAA